MPSATPGGLPYPIGTDYVVDGDDAIRNLATAVDTASMGGSARARATAASAALTINTWATVPLNAQTDVHVSSDPAFTYTPASFGYTINRNGLYLIDVNLTMGTALLYLARIINGGTTLAQQSKAEGPAGNTVSLSVVRWLTAGALVQAQVFPMASGQTTTADTAGSPTTLVIAALTKVN